MQLGTVISLEGSPSTSNFSFVIDTEQKVKRGQFVQNQTNEGALFGFVSEITRANRYFERAESVAEYEKTMPMTDHFPISSWDYSVADVKIL